MAPQRELVLGLPAHPVALRHALGRFAHYLARGALGDLRTLRQDLAQRHELREHADVVHRRSALERERREGVHHLLRELDLGVAGRVAAAGDGHVVLAALDGGRREGHRLQAARAGTRAGHTLHRRRQGQVERDLAGDVRGHPREDHAAPDDGVELVAVQGQSVDRRFCRRVRQRDRVHRREVGEGLQKGRPGAADDDRAPSVLLRLGLGLLALLGRLLRHVRFLQRPTSAPPQTRSTLPVSPSAPGVDKNVIACPTSSGRPP